MDYEALLEPMRDLFYFLSSFDFCLLCTIKAEYNNSRNLKEPSQKMKHYLALTVSTYVSDSFSNPEMDISINNWHPATSARSYSKTVQLAFCKMDE